MKISAVIPTFNRRSHILRAIQSILAQTAPVSEVVIVDDGSTDGTAEEIERKFGNLVRVVRQINQGVSGARHRGVLEAQGDWIAFLDSDDEWTPDRNRILQEAIGKVPADVAWIFGNTQEISDTSEITQYEKFGLHVAGPVHVFADPLSAQYPWQFGPLQSTVIKRAALLELDCFSESFKSGEDLLAGIQVACHYGCAAIPETVTKWYRTSDLSASSLAVATISQTNSSLSADYHRAAMRAFSLAARTVRRQPWGELYAEAVRGMCKIQSGKDQNFRLLSLQQFRFGASGKSIAFFCAAMLGHGGLSFWSSASSIGRRVLSRFPRAARIASNELQK
jgi:Glycosyl transferase family 2